MIALFHTSEKGERERCGKDANQHSLEMSVSLSWDSHRGQRRNGEAKGGERRAQRSLELNAQTTGRGEWLAA